MSSNKVKWDTPQLIILARGTPEESVLLHCKRISATTALEPSAVAQLGCDRGMPDCGACRARDLS